MKPERYAYQDEVEIAGVILAIFTFFIIMGTFSNPPAPVVAPVVDTTPLPTPVINETVTAEPTLSEEQIFETTGGLSMGEWLSWMRKDVEGLKDMSTHVTVYGYRMFGTVDWYSTSWGQYFKQGAGDNQKFLFVFVNSYSDDGSARTWGILPNQFRVQIKDEIYEPSKVLKPEIRLRQFDEIWDLAHVDNIKPYGYLRTYDRNGNEVAEEMGYLRAGKSNAWDGYIVFTVPRNTLVKDVKVLGQFGNLIEPHWWQLE